MTWHLNTCMNWCLLENNPQNSGHSVKYYCRCLCLGSSHMVIVRLGLQHPTLWNRLPADNINTSSLENLKSYWIFIGILFGMSLYSAFECLLSFGGVFFKICIIIILIIIIITIIIIILINKFVSLFLLLYEYFVCSLAEYINIYVLYPSSSEKINVSQLTLHIERLPFFYSLMNTTYTLIALSMQETNSISFNYNCDWSKTCLKCHVDTTMFYDDIHFMV